MKSPVTSITDDQLAELEEFVHVALFADEADAGLTMGEMRGLIARMRAPEADAKRYRWITENCDIDYRGHRPDGDYASSDEVIDSAMERKA